MIMKKLFKVLPVMALTLGGGLALAFAGKAASTANYEISHEDDDFFYVGTTPPGECDESGEVACQVSSPVEPSSGKISKSTAGVQVLSWRAE